MTDAPAPIYKRRRAGEAPATCQIEGCGKPHQCRDMCANHYQAWHYQNRVAKDPELLRRYRERRAAYKANPEAREREAIRDRAHKLRRHFGISVETYQSLHAAQNGACAICRGYDNDRCLAVDHCHKSGAVRGLLCGECNRGIGQLRDSPALLRAAAEYLERQPAALPVETPIGRGAKRGCKGVNARLTPEQVREIRNAPAGTSFSFANANAVCRIRSGKIYRWVE